jgi:[ribosomal protein S5]-alanine N-acetyltransferase
MKTITGKGFLLRHFRESDANKFLELMKDKDTQQGFMNAPKTLKRAEESVKEKLLNYKRKKPEQEAFVIEIQGEFAGYIELCKLNQQFFEHKGAVSYALLPQFRGKGVTAQAVKLLTTYSFKTYPQLRRIEGWCRSFNKGSARTLEKAGYKLEGVLRKNKNKNGKLVDDMIWAKIK